MILFQFLISLEDIMLSSTGRPCSFEDLTRVVFYFTRLPMELLASAGTEYANLSDRWNTGNRREMIGDITVALVRRLMLQCPSCFRRIAIIAKVYHQNCAFHLDHDTERFIKCGSVSHFKKKSRIGYVKWIIIECFKIRGNPCSFCHEFGKATTSYLCRLNKSMVLQYGLSAWIQDAYENKTHLTVSDVLRFRELNELIVDWYNKGAWRSTKIPLVSFGELFVSLWKKLNICLHDVCVLTEKDYAECNRTTRVEHVTTIIANVITKLSGKCIRLDGCNECFLNVVPVCTSGIEFNHMDPKSKDVRRELSQLRHSIWQWIHEARRGKCDPNCAACHGLITAFQRDIIERPAGYLGN